MYGRPSSADSSPFTATGDRYLSARAQLSGEWASISGSQRGAILNRVADLIERGAELLARLEALDVGKPVTQPAMLDVPNAARSATSRCWFATCYTVS